MNGIMTPPISVVDADGCAQHATVTAPRAFLQVPATNVIDSAHYGYVYCMALLSSPPEEPSDEPTLAGGASIQLVTGSGDETVKVTSTSE